MRIRAVAAVAYFVTGALLLAGRVAAFLRPDPYSGARLVTGNQEFVTWVGWLLPIAVMVFAVLIRGGGNGVRVTLTVLAVLVGLAALSVVMDRRPGDSEAGIVVGVLVMVLCAFAVVLHYLPGSGAYIRRR